MERMHQYPRNFGGVALLLLRVCVGLLLVLCINTGHPSQVPSFLPDVALAICIGLSIGILTEVLSGIALIGGVILLCTIPIYWSLLTIVTLLLCVVTSLLGAGAYSLDGVFFGRRRIIL